MACRELLLTLSRMGLITLPPRLNNANNEKRNRSIPVIKIDQTPLQEKLTKLSPIDLKPVRNTKLAPLYNSLIHQHHYLGYRQIVGNHLKYIAFIDERPVACLGWGSAAWKVKSRDTFIGLRLVGMSLRLGELATEDQKRQPAFCRQQYPLPYFTLDFRQMPGLQTSGFKCPKNL
jgi:hypothetical protein